MFPHTASVLKNSNLEPQEPRKGTSEDWVSKVTAERKNGENRRFSPVKNGKILSAETNREGKFATTIDKKKTDIRHRQEKSGGFLRRNGYSVQGCREGSLA